MAMTAEDVTLMARLLMNEYNLDWPAWGFRLSRHKLAVGQCQWNRYGTGGTIIFSKNYLHLPDYEIKDTLLHEIAHAKCGPGAGHGPEWKRMARLLGAKPEAKMDLESDQDPEWKWTGICPNNPKHIVRRHALTERGKRMACGTCCKMLNEDKFSPRYLFEWHLTADLKAAGSAGEKLISRAEGTSLEPTRISEIMAAGF